MLSAKEMINYLISKGYVKNQKEILAMLNISSGLVSQWKSGRSKPSINHLDKLVECLGISWNELLTGKSYGDNFCENMRDLYQLADSISVEKDDSERRVRVRELKEHLDALHELSIWNDLDSKSDAASIPAPLEPLELPVIGSAAADNDQASRAEFYDDGGYDVVQITKPHYQLVKVYGDSMEPVVLDGQFVIIGSEIRKNEKIRKQGVICVVQIRCDDADLPEDIGCGSGICTFVKRVFNAGADMLMLTSINAAACSPFTVMRHNVMHMWPVHGVIFAGHGRIPED